jgi:hypothetical protein
LPTALGDEAWRHFSGELSVTQNVHKLWYLFLNFLNEGGAVKVCKASKPRKSEVTFRNNKYTIFNMGHQKACGRGFMNGTANLPAFGIVKGL